MFVSTLAMADSVLNNAIKGQCEYNVYGNKGTNNPNAQSFMNGTVYGIMDVLGVQNKLPSDMRGKKLNSIRDMACKRILEEEFYKKNIKKHGHQSIFSVAVFDGLQGN